MLFCSLLHLTQLWPDQAMSDRQDDLQRDIRRIRKLYKSSEYHVVEWLKSRAKAEFAIDDTDPLLLPRLNGQGQAGYPDLRKLSDRVLSHFEQQNTKPYDVAAALFDVRKAIRYRREHVDFIVQGGGESDSEHESWIELFQLIADRIRQMTT